MQIEIQAMEIDLPEEEIKKHLPPETLERLKGKKVFPYVIGHEGESRPMMLEGGQKTQKILRWPRAVVRRIAESVKAGTKFFINHGETNSHEGRKPVGEIVATFVRDGVSKGVKGLQAVALGVLSDEAKDMDVCSIEADIHESNGIVEDVNEVTGSALGSSDKDSPAFPGARRLAAIQCFGENTGGEPEKNKPGEGEKQMTFEEVKKAVKDLNIFPYQLYSEEEIRKDKVFGKVFDERDAFEKKAGNIEKEYGEFKTKSEEAIKTSAKATAKERLEKLLPEGLTDKQKAFIKKQFDPEKVEDLSDDSLKGFVESAQKDFSEMAKLFGVAEEKPSGGHSEDGESQKDPVEEAIKKTIGEDKK